MKKDTRLTKVQNMIFASMQNLFNAQDELSFDKFTITVLEALMMIEREEFLKNPKEPKDSANGSYLRDFRSLRTNSLQISIPRSRKGLFKPMIIDLIRNQQEQVNQLALLLYRKGLSSRDVSNVMEEFFGESISRETVNNLASSFHDIRMTWLKRPLDAYYKVVYCDALYVNLKRNNSYSKEAVHVMYGVKEDNTRELLSLEANPTESSRVWGEYIQNLKSRGVENIDLFVVDGIQGFDNEVYKTFPDSKVQRCVVHLQRYMLSKIRPKDKVEFGSDLKEVFNNFESVDTIEKAYIKAEKLTKKWKDSYKFISSLEDEDYLRDYFTYLDYPVEVRRLIYTTNSIENLNRQIRRVIKTKVTFDREDNLLDLIYMVIKDFEFNNWQKYPVFNFQFFKQYAHVI